MALRLRRPRREVERLPPLVQAIRVAELLYFPVAVFMLVALPVPAFEWSVEMRATLAVIVEAFAAVAVFVGLGKRRLWAFVLAMVLAAWVLINVLLNGWSLVYHAISAGDPLLLGSSALLVWVFLTQTAALGCALALRHPRATLR